MLIADDLHEADVGSLLVLLQLVPVLETTPVALVATLRAEGAHPDGTARDLLRRLTQQVETLDLAGLADEDLPDLVRALLSRWGAPRPQDDRWARHAASVLAEPTRGNPQMVIDLLTEADVPHGARPEPAVIAEAAHRIGARPTADRVLASLPEPALEALSALAGLGGRAELALLSEIVGVRAQAMIPRAQAAGVVEVAGDTVAFTQPSYRHAARAFGGSPQQHAAIARALEQRGRPGDRQLAVRHLVHAGALVPREEVFDAARDAAADAELVGDLAVAAEALAIAIDHHPGERARPQAPTRAALRLRAAWACHHAGQHEAAWEHARRVADPGAAVTPAEHAEAALLLAQGRELTTDRREALEALTAAEVRLGPAEPWSALVLAARANLLLFEREGADIGAQERDASTRAPATLERVRQLADRARAVAGSHPEAGAYAALVWRRAHTDPAWHAERREVTDRAADQATDPMLRGHAQIAAGLDALEAGAAVEAEACWAQAAALASQTGHVGLRFYVAVVEAMRARAQGRLEAARAGRSTAGAISRHLGLSVDAAVSQSLGALLDLDVDLDSADVDALLAAGRHGQGAAPRASAALALALRGQAQEASELVHALAAALADRDDREGRWLLVTALLADAVATLERADLAPAVRSALAPWRSLIAVDLVQGLGTLGCVARPLGRMLALEGDLVAAERAFDEARRRDEDAGLHLCVLRGDLDRLEARVVAVGAAGEGSDGPSARHALQPGDHEQAAMLAQDAEDLGAQVLAERARGLADRAHGLAARARERDAGGERR